MKTFTVSSFAAMACAALWCASPASAALLFYDGIPANADGAGGAYKVGDNAAGTALLTHPSIIGFTGNNKWANGTTALMVYGGGLDYPSGISLASQPGSIRHRFELAQTGWRTSMRAFSPALAGDFYFSALLKYETLSFWTADGVWSGAGFLQSFPGRDAAQPLATGFIVGFRRIIDGNGSRVSLVLMAQNQVQVIVDETNANETYFVAVKYGYDSASGISTIQAAAVTTPEEPAVWTASLDIALFPSGIPVFNHFIVGGNGHGDNNRDTIRENLIDEFRIGTLYSDVAGVSGQPPVFEMLGTTVGNVATNSATLSTRLTDCGDPVAELYAFWGTSNGGQAVEGWQNCTNLGAVAANSTIAFSPELEPNKTYFYGFAASNNVPLTWAFPSPISFITAPVTVSAPSPTVAENSFAPFAFTVARPDAADAVAQAVTVNFSLGGTAVNGAHYSASALDSVVIPAGAASADVIVTPIPDWASADERALTITLLPGYYALAGGTSASVTFTNIELPAAPTNAFIGAVSELASDPANWSLGLPTASHEILVSQSYASRNPTWDAAAPSTVGAWTQPLGTTRTVVFATTPAAPLTILGDCSLLGGVWTHEGPSATPTTALNIAIKGDLTVGAAATINVGRDISIHDPAGLSRGPLNSTGAGFLDDHGGAYAGDGFSRTPASAPYTFARNANTYGSIINPMSYGASSRGGGGAASLLKYSGPGIVLLDIAGSATIAGRVAADGYGYNNNHGAASGGTVNITAARLLGAGSITANGGEDSYYGAGSGGRIRVKLTDPAAAIADFTGAITAYGHDGVLVRGTAPSAAGTIAIQTAADAPNEALIRVANNITWINPTNDLSVIPATHLPAMANRGENLSKTAWLVLDNAKLRVTASARIASLTLASTASPVTAARTPCVFADDATLAVYSLTILGDSYGPGVYRAIDLPASILVGNGAIQVLTPATLIFLR